MDKNTLWGLLLMGAVLFGFMYLNKPNEQQMRELAEQQAAAEAEKTPDAPSLTLDSITPAETEGIARTVRELGKRDSSGVTTLAIDDIDLRLGSDGRLSGTIMTSENGGVPAEEIIYNKAQNVPLQTAVTALKNLRASLADAARYRGFAQYLKGDSSTTVLENEVLKLELSNKGGIIARATLKDKRYTRYDGGQVELMTPGETSYSFTLQAEDNHFETGEFFFTPRILNDSTVLMNLELGNGANFGIRYTLPKNSYCVSMDIVQKDMGQIIPKNISEIDFRWSDRLRRNEAGRTFEERNSAIYYMLGDGDIDNVSESKTEDKEVNERLRWIGFKNQFFSAVLIGTTPFASANLSSTVLEKDPNYLKQMEAETILEYSSEQATPVQMTFLLAPNSYPLFSDIEENIVGETDLHLTKLIPLGWPWVRWINTWIVIPVFDLLGNTGLGYGIIILILTLFIKLILFPFTYKSYKSQAKMRVLAPEIKEINDKYPGNDNAMKRQQETMALYTRAGANPMSGCLPLLLQMPILIAMFNFFPSAIELRGESFLWAKDLSAPDAIVSWTANIPFISSTFGNHLSLFCLLMTATNIIYTKINMQSQAQSASMPGMKWMMYLMPLMFLFIFNDYASGLSYYYFLSLLITIIQTWVFRKVIDEDKVRATMKANAKKPKKKSGFMARLEEAQRRQQQMLKEQERQRGKRR